MLAFTLVLAALALVHASPAPQTIPITAGSSTPATSTSPSAITSSSTFTPSITVLMAIGEFPAFTQNVAPYLLANGTDSFTRSTTLIDGTQTASGLAQLSLANATTNYLYTASYTIEALPAVIQTGFTCSVGTSTATSYGIFGTELSASPTVAPSPTPLVGTLGVCQWTIITTGPAISSSTLFPVTRLFVPAYFGDDGYFTPVPPVTSS